ncbi:MAG TPA: portal protein, partial [Legionella sp.]|nr:portal protein [Legionella sp.]
TQIRKIHFSRHYFHIKRVHITHVLALSACLITGMLSLYLLIFFEDIDALNLFQEIASRLFFYFTAWILIIMLFKIKRIRAALQWYSLDMRVIRRALLLFISFYTLFTVGYVLIHALHIEQSIGPVCQSLFLLAMLASGIYFTYYFFHAHKKLPFVKHHGYFIKYCSVLLFLGCAALDVLGYHALALRLTTSGFITVVIVFITILMIQGVNKSYFILNHHEQTKAKLIRYFGYKPDQVFTEFLIFKIILQLVVIAFSLYFIVRSWGFATYYLEKVYTQLLYGIHIASTTLYPTRIALGILVYCLMFLVFRSISTAISRHQQFEEEEETQVAIASILTYLGFTLALLSGLLVAGFNFTGLAIIAGALSVGIGLGLQSIVNNFVSGLILLIEKPIKPGDRINIDGIEGFVKKISVRSTHIITPAHEDIIVPNSDLITKRVTNYVYSNKQCSINCDINIPHGSNTQRVRELLLDAANTHEEVIKTGRNKPYVLFRAFQEKSLSFQLCCLIKDVNKKLMVQSDLNFTIDLRLRELDDETRPIAH